MSEDVFTIGVVQQACTPDRAANLRQAAAGVRRAAAQGAQIVCLQELFATPYFCQAQSPERFELAERIPGPTVEALRPLAAELGVAIVVPVFERRAAGVYHNSAAVLDADGSLLGVYRKMHIPDDPQYYEKYYFAPGDATGAAGGFRVFRTRHATIGVLICWDQWYPEAARITSLLGAEVLFYPTAIGWHPREKAAFGQDQAAAWQGVQRGHAIANGLYVAAANRVGHEPEPGTDGLEFFGRSFVYDPFGRLIAEAPSDQPAVLVTPCSRAHLETTRRHWPFLRDRRVDAYAAVGQRFLETPDELPS